MKQLFFSFVIALLMFSCTSTSLPPTEVLGKYVKAIDAFNYSQAKKFVTKEFLPSVENIEKVIDQKTEEQKAAYTKQAAGRKYTFTEKESTADTATVMLSAEGDQGPVVIFFELIKEDGVWLINKQLEQP